MITYGGVPLIIPSVEDMERITPHLPIDEIYEFQSPEWTGFPGSWKAISQQERRPLKLGRLHWPRGASRWATAHFLVSERQLDQIRPLTITGTSQGIQTLTLKIDDGTRNIETEMWMLPPRPVHQWTEDDNLYLMTLVDDRYWWWHRTTELLVTRDVTTWSQFYTSIALYLNITLTADTFADAYEYFGPPMDLQSAYDYLPPLLDAVAFSCGQRIVRKLDGTVLAQNASSAMGDSATLLSSYEAQKFFGGKFRFSDTDSGPRTDLRSLVTSRVRVVFPKQLQDPASAATDETVAYLREMTDLDLSGLYDGITPKSDIKTFHSSAIAWVNATGTAGETGFNVDNNTQLADLATQIAKDYYLWAIAGDLSMVFAGVVPWEGEAGADFVEWEAHREEGFSQAEPYSMRTIVSRDTINNLAERMYHHGTYGALSDGEDTHIRRFKLTENLERCGSAIARVILFKDGRWCETSDTFVVWDSLGLDVDTTPSASSSGSSSNDGSGSGLIIAETGEYGFCRYFYDSNRWEVFQIGVGCCSTSGSSSSSGESTSGSSSGESCSWTFGSSTDLRTITGFDASRLQVLGHAAAGCLQWYNVDPCDTSVTSSGG